jgi:hypothetical protein
MNAAAAAAAALRVRVTWRDQMLAAPKQTSWDRGFCLKPPVNGTLVVQLLNTQTPAASAEVERHSRGGFNSSNSSSSSGSSSSSAADPAQSSGQCSAELRVAAVQCSCDCNCAATAGAAAAGADIVLQVSRGLHLSTYDAQSLCDTLNSPAKAAAAGTAAWLSAGFRLAWDPEKRRFAVYNSSTTAAAAAFVLRAQRSSMATQLLGFSERDHVSALSDAPLPLLYTSDDAAAAVGATAQQQQQCARRQCVYSDELPWPCAQPQWQECVWGPPALDLLQQGGKLTVEVWGVKPVTTATATATAPTAEPTCSDEAATAGSGVAAQTVHASSTASDTTAAVAAAETAPVAAATTAAAVTTAATAAAAVVAAAAPRLAIFAPRAARERLLGRAVLNVPQLCSLATGQQLALPMLTCQRPAATSWRSRRRASATSSTLTQDWLVNSVRGSSSAEPDEQSSAITAAAAVAAASCDCASSDVVRESELSAAQQQQQGQQLERSDRSTSGSATITTATAAVTDSSHDQQQQRQQQPAVGTVLCALRLRDQSQLLVQVLQRWTLRRDEKAAAERRAAHATGTHCCCCG